MSRPDEGLIHTWLDGACTPEESARIERLVATDPAWASAVAEARGLIAASSRIVGALDAVPRAMPEGSRAAPSAPPRARFRVHPWMRVAAGVVLVAGTAYVLRERAQEPFAPAAQVDIGSPAVTPVQADSIAPTVALGAAAASSPPAAPIETPTAGPARATGNDGAAAERTAPPAPAPTTAVASKSVAQPAAPPPPIVRTEARAEEAGEPSRTRELSGRVIRQDVAPLRSAPAAALQDASVPLVRRLEGCWRVSAPPSHVGLLRDPVIVRQAGDSLVLRTTGGDVSVVRATDRLAGGLVAVLEPCPATP